MVEFHGPVCQVLSRVDFRSRLTIKQYFLVLKLLACSLVKADMAPSNAQSRGNMESLAEQAIIRNTVNTDLAQQIFAAEYIYIIQFMPNYLKSMEYPN